MAKTAVLRRRAESVTAAEVLEWLKAEPSVAPDSIKDVERAIAHICRDKSKPAESVEPDQGEDFLGLRPGREDE